MSDVRTHDRVEGAVEPKKAWRNRYRLHSKIFMVDGTWQMPGEHWSIYTWPSKDVAETNAAKWMATQPGARVTEYLGAFPVDD